MTSQTPSPTTARPRLKVARIAALLLAVYAVLYGVAFVLFGLGTIPKGPTGALWGVIFVILVASPFVALHWLNRLRLAPIGKAVWIVAAIMAVPTVFCAVMCFDMLQDDFLRTWEFAPSFVVLFAGPLLLSAWLFGTFVWAGLTERRA